ncbi:MAG: tetratricopeptide repeat protein [Candidatus Margulisiibacteriota bacterium]
MKKVMLVGVVFLVGLCCLHPLVYAEDLSGIPKENLVISAGPTNPGEELSLVWLETVAHPKTVAKGGKLSLFAVVTSKVQNVSVAFDFNQKDFLLVSTDGMSWNGVYTLPSRMPEGVHVAHFTVRGSRGRTVVRSLEFFVDANLAVENDAQQDKLQAEKEKGWPVKVANQQAFLANEQGEPVGSRPTRTVNADEKIIGLYKEPWYRVRFADGTEGWVIASAVEEPAEDFYRQGYSDFVRGDFENAAQNYQKALMVDANLHKARYWLAKTYIKAGKDSQAADELAALLKLDPTNYNAGILATRLADQYFSRAHGDFMAGSYQKALMAYQKALELKSSFVTAQIELGQCYQRLGFAAKAREAWVAAFVLDPENQSVRAFLDMGKSEIADTLVEKAEVATDKSAEISAAGVSVGAADYSMSIDVIKNARTQKGTSIHRALADVLVLTRSFGTLVKEKGWMAESKDNRVLVSYTVLQDQSGSGKSFKEEYFSWAVDQATQNVIPLNKNAKMLMSSW